MSSNYKDQKKVKGQDGEGHYKQHLNNKKNGSIYDRAAEAVSQMNQLQWRVNTYVQLSLQLLYSRESAMIKDPLWVQNALALNHCACLLYPTFLHNME